MTKPDPVDEFNNLLDHPNFQRNTSAAIATPVVRDMLHASWLAARSVFRDAAKPEHALVLLPILLSRADAERQRLRDEIAARTSDESAPKP